MFNVNRAHIEENKSRPIHIAGVQCTWRSALQTLGTEWGRNHIDPYIWVNLCKERIVHHAQADRRRRHYVVSDCRFINEYAAFYNDDRFDPTLLCIHRRDADPQTHHASEVEIEELTRQYATYHYHNNGTLFELTAALDDMLERLFDI